MILDELVTDLLANSPVAMMTRGLFEYALADDFVNALFATHARTQYQRQLLFSHVVDLMALVAVCGSPSLSSAIAKRQAQLPASRKAVYDKINHTEPAVTQALLADTALRLAECIREMGDLPLPKVADHRLLVLDGNALAGTHKRITPLRTEACAALPGKSLVIYDVQLGLVTNVVTCEDGHAQERSLTDDWLALVKPDDLYLADRNFCTQSALCGIADKQAAFVIRQHAKLPLVLTGERRECGKTADGSVVYEQQATLEREDKPALKLRRITVELASATRHNESELHIVTNVPSDKLDGVGVAGLYRERWQIEGVFGELKAVLESEVNTLGYPKAAIFAFCVALVAYNVIRTVKHAISVEHKTETDELSSYYLGVDISHAEAVTKLTMLVPLWSEIATMTPVQMARWLQEAAKRVGVGQFRKTKRGSKKPRPQRAKGGKGNHVSTHKVLKEVKAKRKQA